MKLEEWRAAAGITYKRLSEMLDVSENKAYRLCNHPPACVRLVDAYKIVEVTGAQVDFPDLLGDC